MPSIWHQTRGGTILLRISDGNQGVCGFVGDFETNHGGFGIIAVEAAIRKSEIRVQL